MALHSRKSLLQLLFKMPRHVLVHLAVRGVDVTGYGMLTRGGRYTVIVQQQGPHVKGAAVDI